MDVAHLFDLHKILTKKQQSVENQNQYKRTPGPSNESAKFQFKKIK